MALVLYCASAFREDSESTALSFPPSGMRVGGSLKGVFHYRVYLHGGCTLTHRPAATLTDERRSTVTPICQRSAYRSTRHTPRRPGRRARCHRNEGAAKHERPKLLEAGVKHERRANDDLRNKRRIFFPFRGWRCDAMMNVSALLSAMNKQTSQV